VEIADQVMEALLIMPPDFSDPLDTALLSVSPIIAGPAKVFRGNLDGNLRVANLLYLLTFESVQQQRFNAIFTAERIRLLKAGPSDKGEFPPERLREAMTIAQKKMKEFADSPEGHEETITNTLHALNDLIQRPDLRDSLQELVQEAVVMIWGTFEVFISDSVRSIANASPTKAADLFSGATKKYLPNPPISMEKLIEYKFDLSQSMGDVFFAGTRLDSLPSIKDTLKVLYPNAGALHAILSNDALWKLWQRRNLIVHRRGVVDQPYLSKTGDKVALGERIHLKANYIEEAAKLVRDAAIELISTTRTG